MSIGDELEVLALIVAIVIVGAVLTGSSAIVLASCVAVAVLVGWTLLVYLPVRSR